MFQTNTVENINTRFMLNNFPRNSCCLSDSVKKCGRAGQVKEETIIWSMRFVWWITKATDAYSEYAYILFLHCKMVTRKLLNIKNIHTLPVFIRLLVRRPEGCQAATSTWAQPLFFRILILYLFHQLHRLRHCTVWVMRASWGKPHVRNILLALFVTSWFAFTILHRILAYEIQQSKTPNTSQSVFILFFVNGVYYLQQRIYSNAGPVIIASCNKPSYPFTNHLARKYLRRSLLKSGM